MIRRDYLLRMVEEFIQMLARLNALKRERAWDPAAAVVDAEFQKLTGLGTAALARLSETELLARVTAGEPTQVVRQKTLMVARLLSEAAEVADIQGRFEESRACYLQGLHLLLGVLGRGEVFEMPEFAPRIEALVLALGAEGLPSRTQALLMEHYERTGEFAKAEDLLFAMLDARPDEASAIAGFGMGFYHRLLARSDAVLAEGNLPRREIEQGMAELRRRAGADS